MAEPASVRVTWLLAAMVLEDTRPRYGFSHAWTSSPRACASVSSSSSGSQPGSRPCVPVRKRLHGSSVEGYSASDSGRTWKKSVLRPASAIESTSAVSDARPASTLCPAEEGQSRLTTDATHTPRSSRSCETVTSVIEPPSRGSPASGPESGRPASLGPASGRPASASEKPASTAKPASSSTVASGALTTGGPHAANKESVRRAARFTTRAHSRSRWASSNARSSAETESRHRSPGWGRIVDRSAR